MIPCVPKPQMFWQDWIYHIINEGTAEDAVYDWLCVLNTAAPLFGKVLRKVQFLCTLAAAGML